MKIIGVDPGLGRTGWAILNEDSGKVSVAAYGCIETEKNSNEVKRLSIVNSSLDKIIKEQQPDVMAIEKLFFSKNVKTALSVGQSRGVALLAASENGLVVEEYTPLQVKIAVTGYGQADKRQVGQMIKSILKLETLPKPDDAADALAIALTHAVSYKVRNLA